MLPAGEITERAMADLAVLMAPGDAIIDGGNRHYVDDLHRGAALAETGIHYADIGVSGGVFGLERGFCLMVGSDDELFARMEPLFVSLAPGVETAERTRGREGAPAPAEMGYLHCGPVGAGHFVKMVHNGIEYGAMAALAEGLNVLHGADVGDRGAASDAETTPLEHPERYRFSIDVAEVAEVWRRGSVVSSWLLDLAAAALHESPKLDGFAGRVSDSGEGRWTADRGDRRRRADARAVGGAVRAVLVARRGGLREPRPVGDAQGVRRPRGAAGARSRVGSDRGRGRSGRRSGGAARRVGHRRRGTGGGGRRGVRARSPSRAAGRRWRCSRPSPTKTSPGQAVGIWQVDERIAPLGHDDRGLTHLIASLPTGALDRVRPMPVDDIDPDDDDCARGGRRGLRRRSYRERFDLIHLGLGADGHTASLVPGDAVLDVRDRDVAITGAVYQGRRRMTLTFPVLDRARQILWVVAGAERLALSRSWCPRPDDPRRAGRRNRPAGDRRPGGRRRSSDLRNARPGAPASIAGRPPTGGRTRAVADQHHAKLRTLVPPIAVLRCDLARGMFRLRRLSAHVPPEHLRRSPRGVLVADRR